MKLYLFKVFSRNTLKMVGIFFVFMLVSLLIVSPAAISYAERERQIKAQIEAAKNHMILIYRIENIGGLSIPEIIDYINSILIDIPILNESLIGLAYEQVRIKLDGSPPIVIETFSPIDKVEQLMDIDVLDGVFDIGPGKIALNSEVLIVPIEGGEFGVGSEVTLLGVDGGEYKFNVTGIIVTSQYPVDFPGPFTTPREYSIVSIDDFIELVGDSPSTLTIDLALKFDSDILIEDQLKVLQTLFNVSQTINEKLSEKFEITSLDSVNNIQNILMMRTFSDIAAVTITVFYSFPYIFGIWFLTVVNMELIIRSFRRDIGLLQLRGVPNKVVRRYFLVYMFIIATFGMSAGILISPYIGNLIIGYLGYDSLPSTVFYSYETVLAAFILGYILLFIAFYRRAGLLKDISPISVARKYFEPFERTTWSPSSLFLVFFILAIIKMVEWALAINLNEYITGLGPLSPILIIYSIVSSFMNILAPIIVVYGVINLIIYKTSLISKLTEFFSYILARKFRGIVYRYSGRLPGLISKTTFLSGLLISLMLYYVIFSGRTLYYLNEVSAVQSRFDNPVYLHAIKLDTAKLDKLITYVEDILVNEGVAEFFIGVAIQGSVKVFGASFGLNYLYVDDIYEIFKYMGLEDWMLVRYRDKMDIFLTSFVVESIENDVGGDIRDVKLTFEFYTSTFTDGRNFLVREDYIDGYIGVNLGLGDIGAFIDRDFLDLKELNTSFQGMLVIFSNDSVKISSILKNYLSELKEYGVINIGGVVQYSPSFSLSDMMSFLQKNLYSFNVYAIVAVAIAITLLSIEYVMDMVPDLIVMRSRGLASASKKLAYSLIVPITLFSVIVGLVVGVIAGYGASQQTISTLSNTSPNIPLFIDLLAPIYLGAIILISLLIPLVILGVIHRRYVREVVHFG